MSTALLIVGALVVAGLRDRNGGTAESPVIEVVLGIVLIAFGLLMVRPKRKDDETVVFSWITWPDRKTRDSGMEKAMADPRLKDGMDQCPFDGQRMIFGGFQVIVEA